MLTFSQNYFNAETKDGFFIDARMKHAWAAQLEVLEEIRRVCDILNIRFFADWGTLLGAVRHKGFIPWDDDLDVAMYREDYQKLCEIGSEEFKEPYFFQNGLTDQNYFFGYGRIRRSDTTGIVLDMCEHKYNNGIFIDIFVYDKLPKNKLQLKWLVFRLRILEVILRNYHYKNSRKKTARCFYPIVAIAKKIHSYEYYYNKYIRLCSKNNHRENIDEVGFLCSYGCLYATSSYKGITNLEEADFEDIKIKIPSNYDEYLRKEYGNYWEFPPENERGHWHDNVIIFDPNISYLEYYRKHSDRFDQVLKEYEEK